MTARSVFSQLVREPSLAERVTEAMLESIHAGQLSAGDRLPSERELCDQFGVSRTIVREAIRGLQAKGLVDVRAGRPAVVTATTASHVSESIRLFVRGNSKDSLDPEKISEVRATLEVRMTELAAVRATDTDLEQMEIVLAAMAADVGRASEHDAKFHRLIAAATQNVLFVILLDTVGDVLMEIRRGSLALEGRRGRALVEHRRILDALRARDVPAARAAMEHHLAESMAFYSAKSAT